MEEERPPREYNKREILFAMSESYIDVTIAVSTLAMLLASLDPSDTRHTRSLVGRIWSALSVANPALGLFFTADDQALANGDVENHLIDRFGMKVLFGKVEKMLFARKEGSHGMRFTTYGPTTVFIDEAAGLDQAAAPEHLHQLLPSASTGPRPRVGVKCERCLSALSARGKESLYHDLPGPGWFRLLTIAPGAFSTPLICELACHEHANMTGRYECLSYSWRRGGWKEKEVEILANGVTVMIQPNLEGALQRLRDTKVSRTVWIDALCINQSDLDEKRIQISMMPLIYGASAQTNIWLGELRNIDIYEAMEFICDIVNQWDQKLDATYHQVGGEYVYKKRTPLPSIEQILRERSRYRVAKFFSAQWFCRRWVIQEVVHSPSAVVLCSDFSIAWPWLGLAAAIVRMSPEFKSSEVGISNAYLIYRLSRHGNIKPADLTFLQLLRLAAGFETSESRDAVYALLGIRTKDNPETAPILEADYSVSLIDVHRRILDKLTDPPHPLGFLSSANHKPHRILKAMSQFPWGYLETDTSSESSESSLPSWLPQWNDLSAAAILTPWSVDEYFEPTKGLEAPDKPLIHGDALIAKGIELSIVSFRSEIVSEHFKTVLGQILNGASITATALMHHLPLLSKTFTAGRNQYGGIAVDGDKILSHFAAWFAMFLESKHWPSAQDKQLLRPSIDTLKEGGDPDTFLTIARQVCSNRPLFVTASGHLGLGPSDTAAGDRLCILAGHKMPVLLRPKGEKYTFVGDCYVDDVMRGEAVVALREGRRHLGPFGQISNIRGIENFLAAEEEGARLAGEDLELLVQTTEALVRERYGGALRETGFEIV